MNHKSVINSDLSSFWYNSLQNRFATLDTIANLMEDDKRQLAKHGFYWDRTVYRCAYCATIMNKLNSKTLKYHTFSTCKRSIQLLRENESLRRSSFKNFKLARTKFKNYADRLAENGFFYHGARNEIKCCECALVVIKLSRFDAFHIVHKEYSPFCSFNSENSNNTASHLNNQFLMQPSAPPPPAAHESITTWSNSIINEKSDLINEKSDLINEDNYKLYPILATTDMSHYAQPLDLELLDSKPLNSKSSNDLETAAVVASEKNKMCVVCFEREREICFLPCGHVSVCELCATKCKKQCWICRKPVKNKIKVYL
ncbi:iap-2 [Hyposidra talaca nucleopolyhedrovirus]|uniref:Iap-2 n=1 Tax=Hyposidra talaca nucleopolyhedrovirus TaxID=1070315 RepID=A0A2Z4HI23_9ABAC|nr:iap-2 [Hyposidra talaca nucleopolyhedrovirus]AWW14421.1 iap-2 [Hyposidra talaca nucleopolyhedrovirus]